MWGERRRRERSERRKSCLSSFFTSFASHLQKFTMPRSSSPLLQRLLPLAVRRASGLSASTSGSSSSCFSSSSSSSSYAGGASLLLLRRGFGNGGGGIDSRAMIAPLSWASLSSSSLSTRASFSVLFHSSARAGHSGGDAKDTAGKETCVMLNSGGEGIERRRREKLLLTSTRPLLSLSLPFSLFLFRPAAPPNERREHCFEKPS